VVVIFTLKGKKYKIERVDVIEKLKSMEPEDLMGRTKYYIEFEGKKYPIKQVIAEVTGLPRIAFTAMDAYRILTKLGFEIKELNK
jgi:5-methylcytosine-specific restriction protein B